MTTINRLALMIAGALGATGVAAAAASSHSGAALLGPYALIALTHAPSILALGLFARTRLLTAATLCLSAGAVLFCADLAMRHFVGTGLFPFSAPIGGALLISGWLIAFTAGVVATKR